MRSDPAAVAAKADWLGRIDHRRAGTSEALLLPAPSGVSAVAGRGQVTVDWDDVPGAAGYLVHRGPNRTGPFTVIDHDGEDVAAVPHGPYTDTTEGAGSQVWYAVSAVIDVDTPGEISQGAAPGQVATAGTTSVRVSAAFGGRPATTGRSCADRGAR